MNKSEIRNILQDLHKQFNDALELLDKPIEGIAKGYSLKVTVHSEALLTSRSERIGLSENRSFHKRGVSASTSLSGC